MGRTVGDDAIERKVIEDIAEYGWHCVHIGADDEHVPFTFTVGLFETWRHPELLIFGLSFKLAHRILQTAVEAVRAGTPIDLSRPSDRLLVGFSCCFVEVPRRAYREHVGLAIWYHEGDDFPLQQVVFPSAEGRFPWHPEASDAFRLFQPVLGIPTQAP